MGAASSFFENMVWPVANIQKIQEGEYVFIVPYGVFMYLAGITSLDPTITTQHLIVGAVGGTVTNLIILDTQKPSGQSVASNSALARYHKP